MRARYTAIYKLHGANTIAEAEREAKLLDISSPKLEATLSDDPDLDFEHIDKAAAIGAQIDEELRSGLGAVYTPHDTMLFMVELGRAALGQFRQRKIVEPACGSGHFYREIYRRYIGEVKEYAQKTAIPFDASMAHTEALRHLFGRDIDPFAVQLTLLSTFLEQLKDNVRPGEGITKPRHRWLADRSIDTQNSLDPITIDPHLYFDIEKTADLTSARSRRASCERALSPDLLIGNLRCNF
ncbi:MAG: N-6 DNA methylase [Xanthobacteraceae bacterium]